MTTVSVTESWCAADIGNEGAWHLRNEELNSVWQQILQQHVPYTAAHTILIHGNGAYQNQVYLPFHPAGRE